MRERIEDLGVLAEKLGGLVDHALFDETKRPRRPKHIDELFEEKTQSEIEDAVIELFWNIEEVEALLYQCLSIAEGKNDEKLEYTPEIKNVCW